MKPLTDVMLKALLLMQIYPEHLLVELNDRTVWMAKNRPHTISRNTMDALESRKLVMKYTAEVGLPAAMLSRQGKRYAEDIQK